MLYYNAEYGCYKKNKYPQYWLHFYILTSLISAFFKRLKCREIAQCILWLICLFFMFLLSRDILKPKIIINTCVK